MYPAINHRLSNHGHLPHQWALWQLPSHIGEGYKVHAIFDLFYSVVSHVLKAPVWGKKVVEKEAADVGRDRRERERHTWPSALWFHAFATPSVCLWLFWGRMVGCGWGWGGWGLPCAVLNGQRWTLALCSALVSLPNPDLRGLNLFLHLTERTLCWVHVHSVISSNQP